MFFMLLTFAFGAVSLPSIMMRFHVLYATTRLRISLAAFVITFEWPFARMNSHVSDKNMLPGKPHLASVHIADEWSVTAVEPLVAIQFELIPEPLTATSCTTNICAVTFVGQFIVHRWWNAEKKGIFLFATCQRSDLLL